MEQEPCFLLQTILNWGFRVQGVAGVGGDLVWNMALELGLEGCQRRTRKGLTMRENSLSKCVKLEEYAV